MWESQSKSEWETDTDSERELSVYPIQNLSENMSVNLTQNGHSELYTHASCTIKVNEVRKLRDPIVLQWYHGNVSHDGERGDLC